MIQPKNRQLIRVGLVNSYMQGRELLISSGGYPSHHLWGADKLNKDQFSFIIIPPRRFPKAHPIANWFTKLTQSRFGDLNQEIEIWKLRNDIDIVYVASASIFWLLFLHILGVFRPKIVRWTYIPPLASVWWKFQYISYTPLLCWGTDILLCLTSRAAQDYKKKMPWLKIRQMDWGADPIQFAPGGRDGNFFFSCGKTNRDYSSLLLNAASIEAPLHLVVNKSYFDGFILAPNVHVGHGPANPASDLGISYPLLIQNYFHKALALLIPLKVSDYDSAGMTNILEAMACGLPVVMTRTGALDINIEELGVGIYVEPGDPQGWVDACNWLLKNPVEVRQMGDCGRKLVEQHYNTTRLGQELSLIFNELF